MYLPCSAWYQWRLHEMASRARLAVMVRRLRCAAPAAVVLLLALAATAHAADPGFVESQASGALKVPPGPDVAAYVVPPAEPTKVAIGLYLLGISRVAPPSEAFPSYEAELFLDLRWRDPRLAFDPEVEGVGRKVYQGHAVEAELDEIWWPNLEIENEEGSRQVEGRALAIDPDGSVEYTERFDAKFHAEVDLRRFPFDRQTFDVQIESFSWSEDYLVFEPLPEKTGFAEDFHTIEWNVLGVGSKVESKKEVRSPTRFSKFVFEIRAQRQASHYLWKLLLPMLIIVGFTWSSFWMTGEAAGTRMQRGFIALLTLVAFYQVLADNLPRISYLTFLDAVAYLAFASVALTILQIVLAHRAGQAGHPERAERMDVRARWLIPTFFLLGLVALWFGFH